ncbi:Hypothetical predicted protein [Cloeon dipterum]|uniref:RRM domain-containing protein n=1 Tax=Cloeon dipterum TaxID=197152 RepID=A0A8S1DPX7_9INSE|nr:Hypothetical predicted protein [Cloeon dipterum]
MASSATQICGFLAIPVKYKESSGASHWLYCKAHSVRVKTAGKPVGRTLFVVNVPAFFTEDCFQKMFGEFGTVSNVFFHKKPTASVPEEETSNFFKKSEPVKGYKVAYVVFEKSSSLEAVLKLKWKTPKVLFRKQDKAPPSAVQRWNAAYDEQITAVADLQADIDDFMRKFDEKAKGEAGNLKESEGQADEDGWIKVTKKGRKPGLARKESVEQRVLQKESKKKAKKELLNFYTFQIRESKMNHLAELRHKFEEDKKRIAQLRQSRRFRPF